MLSHHQKCDACGLADVVERADVRVIERRDRARFAIEAVAEFLIPCERRRQNLQGDAAIETCVARLVDLAHAAGTEGGLNLVRSEPSTWREGQACGLSPTWSEAARENTLCGPTRSSLERHEPDVALLSGAREVDRTVVGRKSDAVEIVRRHREKLTRRLRNGVEDVQPSTVCEE